MLDGGVQIGNIGAGTDVMRYLGWFGSAQVRAPNCLAIYLIFLAMSFAGPFRPSRL